jgi:hypothetical protein
MPAAGVSCHIAQRGASTAKRPRSCDEDRLRPFGLWGAESGASRNGPEEMGRS